MKHLKMALFSPEFKIVEYKKEEGNHTFKFQTEFIDVERLVNDVRVNGKKLKCFLGSSRRKFVPFQETNELIEILVETMPAPYQPYSISVTLKENSPHFNEFMKYWLAYGKQ